jgi:hypothetical protein
LCKPSLARRTEQHEGIANRRVRKAFLQRPALAREDEWRERFDNVNSFS